MSELVEKIYKEPPQVYRIIDYQKVAEWLEECRHIRSRRKKERLQNLIAMTCMPLVKKVAKTLARRSTDPLEDIIQVGSVGLVKAIKLYDPSVSKNFKSYAMYLITGEIRHYLRDKAMMIKAPRAIQELAYRVHKLTVEMIEELGERPTDKDIAKKMDMPVAKVQEAIDADRRKTTISLDQLVFPDDDDYCNWGDKIADFSCIDAQNIYEDRELITESLKNIDPVLKEIVELTYFQGMSQLEISGHLGLSQMQVSRKLKKALNLLHDIIQKSQMDV